LMRDWIKRLNGCGYIWIYIGLASMRFKSIFPMEIRSPN
jgi:hypothetical protein